MPDGHPIKEAVRTLIQQEIANLRARTGSPGNLNGVVSSINADGTVNVDTASGTLQKVGTPIVRTVGAQVVVVTSVEGAKVAL